jgi:hypothetical protein
MSASGCLVFAPTYAGKEYALDAWIEGYKAYTYQPRWAYQVDNTVVGLQYFETLKKKGIKCSHVAPWTDSTMEKTFHRCWELALEEAEREDAYWVYSVEADNVPAPESLEMMIDIALYGKIHLVTHDYPMHMTAVKASGMRGDEFYYTELGCMLMTRQLLERALTIYDEFKSIPLAIFAACDRYHGGWCKLTNAFEVKHLDGYEYEFPQFQPNEPQANAFCPTPEVPDDYGTKVPPCLEGVFGSCGG